MSRMLHTHCIDETALTVHQECIISGGQEECPSKKAGFYKITASVTARLEEVGMLRLATILLLIFNIRIALVTFLFHVSCHKSSSYRRDHTMLKQGEDMMHLPTWPSGDMGLTKP